jgi:palmitoyl-protein thioesterase
MSSIFENFETQAEEACQSILSDSNFQGEFNVLGLSQGGLIARNIVERCATKGNVRNLVTLGGPHMGVAKIPNCFDGTFCNILNYIADNLVYFDVVQNLLGPAGYFRDPNNLDVYLKDSCFLPYANGEKQGNFTENVKARFSALNAAMFVMFDADQVIYPKETAWFHELQADGSILNVKDT